MALAQTVLLALPLLCALMPRWATLAKASSRKKKKGDDAAAAAAPAEGADPKAALRDVAARLATAAAELCADLKADGLRSAPMAIVESDGWSPPLAADAPDDAAKARAAVVDQLAAGSAAVLRDASATLDGVAAALKKLAK